MLGSQHLKRFTAIAVDETLNHRCDLLPLVVRDDLRASVRLTNG